MMNKGLNCLLIAILAILSMISGCGGSGSSSSAPPISTPTPTPPPAPQPSGIQISIDGTTINHTVSPLIQGQALIYSHEADHIYSDGSMAQLYKDVGAGFLRYPGGTVTTMYHWNDLNGHGWTDSWNGTYDRANDASPVDYMDLDEYITLCRASDCEPMIGINMSSGRNYNRQEDGLNEAIALLQYLEEQNIDVQYLYLDNENHHKGWTAEEYATQINYYAPSLKEYAPNAKLIANWTRSFRSNRNSFATLLNIAGDNFDYIDIHYYWKWGVASWEEWKGTTPMENKTEWYDGGTYVEEINYFNNLMAELGKPNIKLAVMEWNIGPGPHNTDPSHTPFKTALMQSEMQMQMMQGGVEIAALWSTQWPNSSEGEFRFLVDSDDNYKPTPSAKIFELYKHALNGDLVETTSADSQIMATAVIKDDNKAFVYLLNKKGGSESIYINLTGYEILSVSQAMSFVDPGVLENKEVTEHNGYYETILLENTLTMIELQIEKL